MRTIHKLLMALLALVALSGTAFAQTDVPCPECDEDGEPDDSWYSSVDTGVLSNETGILEDTDVSVGENENGRFTWLQYCLQFFDLLGNQIVITYEAFISEDGADVDGSVTVNGEEVANFDDTPVGEIDDATWEHMEELGLETPVDHDDLPEGIDVDECVFVDDTPEVDVEADVTATCEIIA